MQGCAGEGYRVQRKWKKCRRKDERQESRKSLIILRERERERERKRERKRERGDREKSEGNNDGIFPSLLIG